MTRFLYCTLNLRNITLVNKAVLPATIGDKTGLETGLFLRFTYFKRSKYGISSPIPSMQLCCAEV